MMGDWFRDNLIAAGLPDHSGGWIPIRMNVWIHANGNVAIDQIEEVEPPAPQGPMEKMVIDTEARAQATEADEDIEYSVEMDQAIALWLIARNTAAIADRLAEEAVEECPHTAVEHSQNRRTCLMCGDDVSLPSDPGPLGTDDTLKKPDTPRIESTKDIPRWAIGAVWMAATGGSRADWEDLAAANDNRDLWDETIVQVKLANVTARRQAST